MSNLTENQTVVFQSIYQKFDDIDYWNLESSIQNDVAELKRLHSIGDKEALKYNAKEIRQMHENGNKKIALNLFARLLVDIENQDFEDIIYMFKDFWFGAFIYRCYERLTGENLPNSLPQIQQYFFK